jgi:hypothetical protein
MICVACLSGLDDEEDLEFPQKELGHHRVPLNNTDLTSKKWDFMGFHGIYKLAKWV